MPQVGTNEDTTRLSSTSFLSKIYLLGPFQRNSAVDKKRRTTFSGK